MKALIPSKKARTMNNRQPHIFTILICLLFICAVETALAAVQVRLTLNRTAINFPSADPDTVPSVPASENPMSITVRVTGNPHNNWRLQVLASGDLVSGSDVIAISNVSWTASPLPFIDGRLDKTALQTVASGTGNANLNGSVSFYFKNSWDYLIGNYSQIITYTLTAP
jgi:hypothetical protein